MKDLEAAMAEKNGYSNELYVQRIRQGVKECHPDTSDEVAILRKELALHREAIDTLLDTVLKVNLPYTEFVKYNTDVEALKNVQKKSLNIVQE